MSLVHFICMDNFLDLSPLPWQNQGKETMLKPHTLVLGMQAHTTTKTWGPVPMLVKDKTSCKKRKNAEGNQEDVALGRKVFTIRTLITFGPLTPKRIIKKRNVSFMLQKVSLHIQDTPLYREWGENFSTKSTNLSIECFEEKKFPCC